MGKPIICALLMAFALPTLGLADGFKSKPPIKWGNVTEAERKLNIVDYEPDAPAVVLCDYGHIEISNRTFYNRHVRIKILKPEGKQYARIEIPYQHKNLYDDVQILKAQVIHPMDNKKLKFNELNTKDIQDIQIDEYRSVKRFSFSEAEVGSIIEYKYQIASMDFVKLDDWRFQNELPTLWSEIRFEVPEPFIYLVTYQKGPKLTKEEQVVFGASLERLKRTKWRKARMQLHKNDNILFSSPNRNYIVQVVNKKQKKFVHRSLPSFSDQKHRQQAINAAPRIRFHLLRSEGILPPFYKPLLLSVQEGFEDMDRFEVQHEIPPAGFIHYRLESWGEMNKRYLNSERFGLVLVKHFNYMPVVNEAIEDNMSPKEKLTVLTGYLNSHVMWNGVYDSYVRRDLNDALKSGMVSSSELNFMLLYMLRRLGFEAYPVLAKTVDQGRVEEVYPVHKQFNHVLVLVNLKDENLVLDLTIVDETRAKPVNPRGWAVRKTDYGWIDIVHPKQTGPTKEKKFVVIR